MKNKWITLLITLVLVAPAAPVQAAPRADGIPLVNIATPSNGASASADGSQSGYGPQNLIDGNSSTYWVSASTPVTGRWVTINLGASKSIIGFRLNEEAWSSNNASAYTLYGSNDNTNWTPIMSSPASVAADYSAVFPGPVSYQYVKFQPTAGGSLEWLVYEIEIYQTPVISTVTMLTPSVTVDPALSTAIAGYLQAAMPYPTYYYAITNVDTLADDSLAVSYIALTAVNYIGDWNTFENGLGFGTLRAIDQGGTYIVSAETPIQAQNTSSSGYIFPFASGSSAAFGTRGVHDAGFSLLGWKAVDFWSDGQSGHAPNAVYAAAAGSVAWICRDSVQQAMQIGPFLYAHLQLDGTKQGDHFTQGQQIGTLVTGDIPSSNACGWASQGAGSYHVHFGFQLSGGMITIEDWTLIPGPPAHWANGNKRVMIGDWLPSTWTTRNPTNPPPGSARPGLWNGILSGFTGLTTLVLPIFPDHQATNVALHITASVSNYLTVFYMLVKSNFRMEIPVLVVSLILTLEAVRMAYAAWKLMLKALPFLG